MQQRPFQPTSNRASTCRAALRLLLCWAFSLVAACDGPPAVSPVEPAPDAGGSNELPLIDLKFVPDSLDVRPGSSHTIVVRTEPPAEYPLFLALVGDNVSAFLDRSVVTADKGGEASFKLTVPSDGNFTLVASYGSSSARLPVNVTPETLGNLSITALYSGVRKVEQWVVSASQSADCDDLSDYEKGAAFQTGQPIVLERIAEATPITLLARGNHYVYGCREIELTPGVETSVALTMHDRPIQLSSVDFDLRFGFDRTLEFTERLEATITLMKSAFANTDTDADALLAAMASNTERKTDFESTANADKWADMIGAHLLARTQTETVLREQLDGLLRQGTEQLFEPAAFIGRLRADPATPNAGTFEMQTLANLPVEALRITSADGRKASLNSTPPETDVQTEEWLRAGYQLTWQPSWLIGKLAVGRITGDLDAGLGPELSTTLDCLTLAATLAGSEQAGTATPFSQAELDALCESALDTMWTAALEAQLSEVSLEVGAAGLAVVDDSARPLGFSGNWAGALNLADADGEPVPVRGPFASGETPTEGP